MQGKKNRPTREELEEDRFLEWLMDAVEYVKARAQLFIGAAAALIVAILAITYVQSARLEARQEAAELLGQAAIADETGRFDEVVSLCEQLTDKYGGTPAAAQATIRLANRYFAQGRYGDAERLYQSYLEDYGDVDVLVFAAWTGIAATRESQGDMAAAAAKYREYADAHGDSDEAAIALMDAARCYGAAGDRAQQREALERVTRDYASSPVLGRAREELSML
ncbi:tol-pal system YbgF family protein [Candidatus Latescibacterota bacterium]